MHQRNEDQRETSLKSKKKLMTGDTTVLPPAKDGWEVSKQAVQSYMTDLLDAGMPRDQIFDRAYTFAYSMLATHYESLVYGWEYDLKIAKMLVEVADLVGLSHRSRRRMLEEQYARTTEVMESK